MRAITEIPAKTPSPIGKTETDLPGTENALLGVFVAWAESADTDDVLSAAAVADAVAVGTDEASTEDKPLTITPELALEVEVADEVVTVELATEELVDELEIEVEVLVVAVSVVELDTEVASGVSVTVVKPLT